MRELGPIDRIAPLTGPIVKLAKTPKICRAKPGIKLTYTLLSGEWLTFHVHNIERRDTPCVGEGCPHLFGGYHRSWVRKHYTDAWSWLSNEAVVLEVTAGAMDPYIGPDGIIRPFRRGQNVEISRTGPQPHSPGLLRVLPSETNPEQLPASFCVTLALLSNWGADTRTR